MMNSADKRISDATKILTELASAWRNDWSCFDGRTLRSQMNEALEILNGTSKTTVPEFRASNGLCPHGKGHWVRNEWGCDKCEANELQHKESE